MVDGAGSAFTGGRRLAAPVGALLFLSGGAGLLLEAVLVRECTWWLGSSARATAIVLAVFLGGLMAGAALLGPLADHCRRPLALYGSLEVGAGATGLGVVGLLAQGRSVVLEWSARLGPGRAELLETAAVVALLLVPTTLMGGTLAAASRQVVVRTEGLLAAVGGLYGINTLGGAAGVFLAGFELFERLGVPATGAAAAALQIGTGVAAWVLACAAGARPRASAARARRARVEASTFSPGRRALYLGAACLAGLAALGYEVLWARLLQLSLRSYAYSFSLMLALLLLGIVIGATLVAWVGARAREPAGWLGWAMLAGAAYVSASVVWMPGWLRPEPAEGFAAFIGRAACKAAVVILPPTIASGMALPLAVRGFARGAGTVGRDVGWVYAANTAGSIAGALAAGFAVLPRLGAPRGLVLLALVQALAGCSLLWLLGGRWRRRAALALALATALPAWSGIEGFARAFVEASPGSEHAGELLFFHEGATDTIAVVRKRYGFIDPEAKSLLTNGVSMSATVKPVWRYMAAEGHLPVFLAREPRRAAVIGVGTGITLAAVASHPQLERIVALELSEGVVRAFEFFAEENARAHEDPRVRVLVEDGRHFLERAEERFDAIAVEPPPPIVAGSVHLYTLEFYEACRRRLRAGGVVSQWLPLHAQSLRSARMVARTFLEAFPHVQLWMPSARDAVLVGSETPLRLSWTRLRAAYEEPRLARDLGRAFFETPVTLAATFLLDRDGLEAWVGDVPPITDARPWIEFFRQQGKLMRDAEIASLLEVPEASWAFVAGLSREDREAIQREHRALRLYLRSVATGEAGFGMEAARLAQATEFFLYPFGCTAAQRASFARTAPPPLAAQHEARCAALR